jgi:signal transduction histidine kinase
VEAASTPLPVGGHALTTRGAGLRHLPNELLAVASLALSATVAGIVFGAGGVEEAGGRAALHALVVGVPVATGLYAVRHARTERFGRLLIVVGLVWSLAILAESSSSLAYSTGRVVAWLIFPLLVYLMLSFPEGRLTGRRDRFLFRAVTAVIVVLYIGSALISEDYPQATPWAGCDADCPANAFMALSSEPAFVDAVLGPVRDVLGILVLAGVSISLAVRLRGGTMTRQAATVPVLAMGIVSVAVLVGFIVARRAEPDSGLAEALGWIWGLCLPAIAAAFLLGLLQRRLVMSHLLSAMTTALRRPLDAGQIIGVLRSTVGPAAVAVLAWDPAAERWRDEANNAVDIWTVLAPGRSLRVVNDDSGPVAAVVLDAGEDADDELVDAILSGAEMALRGARLRSDLEASLGDLEESRKRIATAASVERRRIERDLHDGAQQRLIAMRMRLSLAEDLLQDDPRAAAEAIHDLGRDVDLALEEIRSLAHGIYPALLADRGLTDALLSVARRAPLDVQVRATGLSRHSSEIESAVYFSCLEALQNVIKHGGEAARAWIELRQDGALRFTVSDDGSGFDVAQTDGGAGLRNMRDRIESLGGELAVTSAPGAGTRIEGSVPLGS